MAEMKLYALLPPEVMVEWSEIHGWQWGDKAKTKELLALPQYAYVSDPDWIAERQRKTGQSLRLMASVSKS